MPLAISTSDPMAIEGGTCAISMSAGVSNAPPPVDVAPTSVPTTNPIKIGVNSMAKKARGAFASRALGLLFFVKNIVVTLHDHRRKGARRPPYNNSYASELSVECVSNHQYFSVRCALEVKCGDGNSFDARAKLLGSHEF